MKSAALAAGDLIVLALVTLVGFGTHGELSGAFLPRMALAWAPLAAGWFLLAPWLGMFDAAVVRRPSALWRPALVMLFAGPLAAVVRGILLGAAVIPVFAVVLSATSALALVIWRGIYLLAARARPPQPAGD